MRFEIVCIRGAMQLSPCEVKQMQLTGDEAEWLPWQEQPYQSCFVSFFKDRRSAWPARSIEY
jgi:hypothetical protein